MNQFFRLPSTTEPEVAYLGLGANLGDRIDFLRRALLALLLHPEITVESISGVFESEFVGVGRQPPYLNACVGIRTTLSPPVLLAVLKATEARLGRLPDSHGQPRTVDLDILIFGERTGTTLDLTLPHPGLRERAFVLEPLLEIAPELRIPDSTETVASACEKIRDGAGPWVRPLSEVTLLPGGATGREEDWRAALAVHCR